MKVRELISELKKYGPDVVVWCHGVDSSGKEEDGQLNVVENRDGVPYLAHWGIELSRTPEMLRHLQRIGDVIKILQDYKDKHGNVPLGVWNYDGTMRQTAFVYEGNISTELRSNGREIDW